MCFVHELEQLVHNGFQKLPMGLEESWVLSDDVHDIGRNNSLVVLTTFHFDKPKQLFDNRYEEAFLGFLV